MAGGKLTIGGKLTRITDQLGLDGREVHLKLDGNNLGKDTITQQGREKHIAVERLSTQAAETARPKSSLDHLAALRQESQEKLRKDAGQLQYARLLRSNLPSTETQPTEK